MTNKNIDPKTYFNWISEVLKDFFASEEKVKLNLNEPISKNIEPLGMVWYDWVLLLITLEIEFSIDIPDQWAEEEMSITLGQLVSNLATLEVSQDKSYGFRKIMALGYQNITNSDEELKPESQEVIN